MPAEKYSISASGLENWVKELLTAAGMTRESAESVAEVYRRASLRGLGHHDIHSLPQRLHWMEQGLMNPQPRLTLVQESPGTEIWEGDRGPGEWLSWWITRRALEKARTQGIAFVSVRHSNHFLAAAPYVEMAAEQGQVLLILSNTDPCMAAPGIAAQVVGNNPLGFAAPGQTGPSLLMDLCMAYSSLGKLQELRDAGNAIPLHWGNNAQGVPSGKPSELLEGGTVNPMAQHKGFALSLMTETLTAGLNGGDFSTDMEALAGGLGTHNQSVMALAPSVILPGQDLAARMEEMARKMKSRHPELRLPGEHHKETVTRLSQEDIPLKEPTWKQLVHWSQKLGVPLPSTQY